MYAISYTVRMYLCVMCDYPYLSFLKSHFSISFLISFFILLFAPFFSNCPEFAVPDKYFIMFFPSRYAVSSWCRPASPDTKFLSLQSCHHGCSPGLYGTTIVTPWYLFFSVFLAAALSILFLISDSRALRLLSLFAVLYILSLSTLLRIYSTPY